MRKSFSLSSRGTGLASIADIQSGTAYQGMGVPKATKALAVSLARENALPLSLVVSAALADFAKKSAGKRRTACLALLGNPPGTFAR